MSGMTEKWEPNQLAQSDPESPRLVSPSPCQSSSLTGPQQRAIRVRRILTSLILSPWQGPRAPQQTQQRGDPGL